MYKDYESLYERFCIMTVDGNLSDDEALYKLKGQTTKDLYNRLVCEIDVIKRGKKNDGK